MAGLGDQRPPGLDWLVRRVEDLEREVRQLKSARSLSASSFVGTLVFRDEDGADRWVMGEAFVDDTSWTGQASLYGVQGYGFGGAVLLSTAEDERGLVYPLIPLHLHEPTPVSVTDSSFVTLFETTVDVPAHTVVVVGMAAQTGASTTAEIRLHDGVSSSSTDTADLGANANAAVEFEWVHPATCGWGDPRSGRSATLSLSVQARRVSGAGSVLVYPPARQYLGSQLFFPDASVTGNPQVFT